MLGRIEGEETGRPKDGDTGGVEPLDGRVVTEGSSEDGVAGSAHFVMTSR
jgi:hypothetical protein